MTPEGERAREAPGYIAVEGPIGVGKTTLARRLASTFNVDTLLEEGDHNPFLERFYRDPKGSALVTQLFFLFDRVRKLEALRQSDLFRPVRVADFLLEKDPLFARINLDSDEYVLYEQIYRRLVTEPPRTPDLVIYLQASPDVLLERIEQRGIGYEQRIERSYLERLNEVYSEFFLYYDAAPLLIVNASAIDLVSGDRDYEHLVDYLLGIRSGRHYFNPTFFG